MLDIPHCTSYFSRCLKKTRALQHKSDFIVDVQTVKRGGERQAAPGAPHFLSGNCRMWSHCVFLRKLGFAF